MFLPSDLKVLSRKHELQGNQEKNVRVGVILVGDVEHVQRVGSLHGGEEKKWYTFHLSLKDHSHFSKGFYLCERAFMVGPYTLFKRFFLVWTGLYGCISTYQRYKKWGGKHQSCELGLGTKFYCNYYTRVAYLKHKRVLGQGFDDFGGVIAVDDHAVDLLVVRTLNGPLQIPQIDLLTHVPRARTYSPPPGQELFTNTRTLSGQFSCWRNV